MSSNESPANITIGPATLAPEAPIRPDDTPWTSRTFRGRMSVEHAQAIEAGMRRSPPAVLPMLVYGEPAWAVMVSSIRATMDPGARPMLLMDIKVVRWLPTPGAYPCGKSATCGSAHCHGGPCETREEIDAREQRLAVWMSAREPGSLR